MSNDFNNNKGEFTYISGLGFISRNPQQYERRHIIIQFNLLIFSVILLCILRNTLVFPIVRFLALIGFDIQINPLTTLITLSDFSVQMANILVLFAYMYIPTVLLMKINGRRCRLSRLVKPPYKYSTRFGVPIILGVSILAQAMVFIITESLNFVGILFSSQTLYIPDEFSVFILFVFYITLLPAFLEELLFRGVMTSSLKMFGDVVAIFVPATLYTLIQPTFDTMAYAFVMGITLGYFAIKSGSIIVPFIGNFLSKGVLLMFTLAEANLSEDVYNLFSYISSLIILVIAIIAFSIYLCKDKRAFKSRNVQTYLTNRAKLKYLFSSFGFWCLVGMAVITAISYIQIID